MKRIPTLAIYWTDTRKLLTYQERKDIEEDGELVSVTPLEILIRDPESGRLAAIRGVTDSTATKPRVFLN